MPFPATSLLDAFTRPDEGPPPSASWTTVTGGQNQESSDAGLIGSLPLTGLQLGIVAGAGLCLLLLGAALRPRRAAGSG